MNSTQLYVAVITPLGRGGKGGVDRLIDQIRPSFDNAARARVKVTFLSTRGPYSILLSPLYLLNTLCRLAVLRAMGRLDIAHINISSYGSTYRKLIVASFLRTLRIPYVAHLHCGYYPEFWAAAPPRLARQIETFFVRSEGIIVLGRIWAKFIGDRLPEVAARITILPNATPKAPEYANRHRTKSTVEILFLGKVCAAKGVPNLISALDKLSNIPSWHATIAGHGDVHSTREQIRTLNLTNRITVPGWLNDTQVIEQLGAADILVLPSFVENMPMSVIEGFAHGLAVVATPVGATTEILTNEVNGLIVAPGDSEYLAIVLNRLILDRKLRARLGKSAQEIHAQRFDISQYIKSLTQLWCALAKFDATSSQVSFPDDAPIFIVGTPRSGTTLTARILGSLAHVQIPGETHFFEDVYHQRRRLGDPKNRIDLQKIKMKLSTIYARYNEPDDQDRIDKLISTGDFDEAFSDCIDYRDVFSAFMNLQLGSQKGRWGNQVPRDVFEIDEILSMYPDAKIIGCIRDPCDFAASYRDNWRNSSQPRFAADDAKRISTIYHPVATALIWSLSVRALLRAQRRFPSQVLISRYEELVCQPDEHVSRLCSFIGEPFHPSILEVEFNNSSAVQKSGRGINTASVGRWKTDLESEAAIIMQTFCFREMKKLQYRRVSVQFNKFRVLGIYFAAPRSIVRALFVNRSKRGPILGYLVRRIARFSRSGS